MADLDRAERFLALLADEKKKRRSLAALREAFSLAAIVFAFSPTIESGT